MRITQQYNLQEGWNKFCKSLLLFCPKMLQSLLVSKLNKDQGMKNNFVLLYVRETRSFTLRKELCSTSGLWSCGL
jgi:hypothetical protein